MIRINCTVYEKHDMLAMLKYAKRKKIEEFNKNEITAKLLEIELNKIATLEKRINGIYREDYYDQASWKSRRENGTPDENDDLPKAPFTRPI